MFIAAYESAKAKYEACVDPVKQLPWYFGQEGLTQNTVKARVVVVPDEGFQLSSRVQERYLGAGNPDGPASELAILDLRVGVYIFAPLEDIFDDRVTSEIRHASRVMSAWRATLPGQFNSSLSQMGRLVQHPVNQAKQSLWSFSFGVTLRASLKLAPEFLNTALITTPAKRVVFT